MYGDILNVIHRTYMMFTILPLARVQSDVFIGFCT